MCFSDKVIHMRQIFLNDFICIHSCRNAFIIFRLPEHRSLHQEMWGALKVSWAHCSFRNIWILEYQFPICSWLTLYLHWTYSVLCTEDICLVCDSRVHCCCKVSPRYCMWCLMWCGLPLFFCSMLSCLSRVSLSSLSRTSSIFSSVLSIWSCFSCARAFSMATLSRPCLETHSDRLHTDRRRRSSSNTSQTTSYFT